MTDPVVTLFLYFNFYNIYKQCWPYMNNHSDIFLEEIINVRNSIPYTHCVTEKRTKVKTLLIGSFPNLLTAFVVNTL
jgi:hypothetical protein